MLNRREFLVLAAAFVVVGCESGSKESLADYLARTGAVMAQASHQGRIGQVVVGWGGDVIPFKPGTTYVFMVYVNGVLVNEFLEDTPHLVGQTVTIKVEENRFASLVA